MKYLSAVTWAEPTCVPRMVDVENGRGSGSSKHRHAGPRRPRGGDGSAWPGCFCRSSGLPAWKETHWRHWHRRPGVLDLEKGETLFLPNLPGTWPHVPLALPFQPDWPACRNPQRCALDHLGGVAFGAGRGVDTLAVFAIGTGIGGGLVVDGRLAPGDRRHRRRAWAHGHRFQRPALRLRQLWLPGSLCFRPGNRRHGNEGGRPGIDHPNRRDCANTISTASPRS